MKELVHLTNDERKLLYKAPALVSVYVSCSYNEINKSQKGEAIKLAHLETFPVEPELLPYYTEVDKLFKEEFESTVKKYFPFDAARRNSLRMEIDKVNSIIIKLDPVYAIILHSSLDAYAKHVRKAAHSIFQDFVFPEPI